MSNIKSETDEYWRSQVETIRDDSIHGSMYLGDAALRVIEDIVTKRLYRNRTELLQLLSKLGNALVRAKPLMAIIFTRTHRIIEFIQSIPKEEKKIEKIIELTLNEINLIREEAAERQKLITRFGARLILDQHVILTHSASSIVESVFLEAKRLRKRFRVICTESRPRFEGVQLAKKLAKAGIKTLIIPDADITRGVNQAHYVFTGADRITENSFINKTGTGAIGVLTEKFEKPFYIAASTDKILLKRTYPVRFRSTNERELLDKPRENLKVQNYYFEEIPIQYLHKIVCETGIFEKVEFIERFL
ncbi:MAG TPA: hypothetical protein ENK14_09905 [Caldithrix sp.]|nr:hypothetical protein [Caldithrix sp.]